MLNINNVVAIIGSEIIAPYFIKSTNENFVLCSLTRVVNIIPASAPVGVRKAPMLLPTIEANVAALIPAVPVPVTKFENNMLIGMLLIRLLAKNDDNP